MHEHDSALTAELEQRHRNELHRRLSEVNEVANDVVTSRSCAREADAELLVHDDAEPDFANDNSETVVKYVLFLLTLPAIYAVDVIVLGPFGEWLAIKIFGASALARGIGRYFTPVVAMALELYVGMRLYHARHPRFDEGDDQPTGAEWLIFALLLALLMPAATVAMFLAERAGQPMPQEVLVQLVILLLLAVLAHVPLIFGGRLPVQAKAYLLHRWRRRRLIRRRDAARAREARGMTRIRILFPRLCAAVENNERWFHTRFTPGLLDAAANEVLRAIFPDHPFVAPVGRNADGRHGRTGDHYTYAGVATEHQAGPARNGGP
jgi:hypothetical protein